MQSSIVLVPCPLCGNTQKFLALNIPDKDEHIALYGDVYKGITKSEWKACGTCGFVHQNPRPTLKALNEYYADSKYHIPRDDEFNVEELNEIYKNCYNLNVEHVLKNSETKSGSLSVLDLGCGLGYALNKFKQLGWDCFGIEPDANRVSFAQNKLGLKNVTQGLIDEKLVLPNNKKVDLIISHHAYEHFADLKNVTIGALNCLKPGGYFFVRVPTYFKNRSKMSLYYMNSAHYSMFTHKSLSQLLAPLGLETLSYEYKNLPGMAVTDDLLLLAKFTGNKKDAKFYFSVPEKVQFYVNVINPLRSFLFAPIYGVMYREILIFLNLPTLKTFKNYLRNPKLLSQKLGNRFYKMYKFIF